MGPHKLSGGPVISRFPRLKKHCQYIYLRILCILVTMFQVNATYAVMSKVTLLPFSLFCHLAPIHQRALILFIQTMALCKSFTYLLTEHTAKYGPGIFAFILCYFISL